MVKWEIRRIKEIIDNKSFCHFFQPIYELKESKIYGYEALLRCKYFSDPEILFQIARECGFLYELDTCSIHNAITSMGDLQQKLFINVFPSTIVHHSFTQFIKKINLFFQSTEKVVFEINESEKIENIELLKKNIQFLKDEGYKVAVDDFGKGEISLETIVDLNPHYIKVDRSLGQNLYNSGKNQDVIKKLLFLCERTNMKLVLEGIEKKEDLDMAKALGVHYAQGYLLGEPRPMRENTKK